MRIIAGKFRSRRLDSLPGDEIRPTSDRLRETLFNVLTPGNPAALEGSVWVDLFAGTGAVGIEALSRGAAMVYFIDSSNDAVNLIRLNLRSLAVDRNFQVLQQKAERAISSLDRQQLRPDYIFLDPPYAVPDAYQRTLEALSNSEVAEKALIIAEHARRKDLSEKFGRLQRQRKLEQGDAALSFYRRTQ
ncbi:MAG: 16S rRNA (guanine(966)-N(2))-methyltransferase RsmD [Terriglobales bacterium]